MLGVILALIPSTHIHLLENGVDIIVTLIISIVFAYFLLWQDLSHPMSLTTRVIGMVVCALLLVPYSLKANSGKIWTLIVVIPGKIVLSVLILYCVFIAIAYLFAALKSRENRGINLFNASLYGILTFGCSKIIQRTKKEYIE